MKQYRATSYIDPKFRTRFAITTIAACTLILTGCFHALEWMLDNTPPSEVRNLEADVTYATSVVLSWTDPPEDDFKLVRIEIDPPGADEGTGAGRDVAGAGTERYLREVGPWEYTFTLRTEDEHGNTSNGVAITIQEE